MLKKILVISVLFSPFSFAEELSQSELKKFEYIYKKKLRKYCRFSGVRFARTHTADEWAQMKDKMQEEIVHICPRAKDVKLSNKELDLLYKFSTTYSKDSSKVPSC